MRRENKETEREMVSEREGEREGERVRGKRICALLV